MFVKKKPVIVESYRPWDENAPAWFEEAILQKKIRELTNGEFEIDTLEGMMIASPGDYIMKGIKGELYPCKPDIYAMTYEDAELCADDRKKTLEEIWPAPRKLETIQKNNALNEVYAIHDPGESGADCYSIWRDGHSVGQIDFQTGPRHDPASTEGVNEIDLLEIVRDRLQHFQQGDYRCRENAIALTHIEEALFWLVKRADDRAARGVLGTHEV